MKTATAKRSPGRPRNFDAAQALESAMLLFWRHGYEGVSIAQLTEAMGIKPASLYAAFGSKEALYRQALKHYVLGPGHMGVAGLASAPTAREGVAHVLREAVIGFTRPGYPPGCMVGLGALQCGAESQIPAEETKALRGHFLTALRERLERGQVEGELPPRTDLEALAAYYAAVIEGLSVQARDGIGPAVLLRVADIAMAAWPAP